LAFEAASDSEHRVADNKKTVGDIGNKKPQHPFGPGVLKQRRVTLAYVLVGGTGIEPVTPAV
jgi:hypothetical protein